MKDIPAPGSGAEGFSSRLTAFAVGMILLVHGVFLGRYFGGWAALVSSEPLLTDDHSWHFYYSILGRRFLCERGTTWGYDPYLMAGYPTDVLDTSDRLLKVALVPLGFLSAEVGYKLLNFVLGAITPLLFYAAGRWFGLTRKVSLLATVLGVWAWWSGGGLEMFAVGMVGFGLASLFGLAVAALWRSFLEAPSRRGRLLLLAAAPLALLIHPGILGIIAFPGLAFYLLRVRKTTWPQHGFLVLTGVLAIGANLFWILPLLQNVRFATPSPSTHLQDPLFFLLLLGMKLARQYTLLVPLLLVAGPIGLVQMHRRGHRELATALGFSVLCLSFISGLGGFFFWLRQIQPVRYGLPLFYLLVFPAAFSLFHLGQNLWRGKLSSTKRRLGLAALAALTLSLGVSFLIQWLEPPAFPFVGMNREVAEVRDWLIQNTDRSARVMIEDNGPLSSVFPHTYPTSPLAYYTGRELIGGPHWATHLKNHHADLSGFLLCGRSIFTIQRNDLAAAMDLYNIGWVVAKSALERGLFDQHPDLFEAVGEAGGHRCYRVLRERNFFLEGRGQVRADYNRFHLSQVSTDSDRVVLAYHWHPLLFVPPPSVIVRVDKGDDPVGFIGILHPTPEMEITVKRWPWE